MADETPSVGPPPPTIRAAARIGTLVAVVIFGLLLTEGSLSGLVARGPFTSDFFDAQAHSLLAGRLDVDPDVAGIEGFVRDGRTQLYFGLVPAVLRLPIAAVTERFDGRLTQVSMLVALAVATWASSRLLWRARVRRRGDRPVGRWEPWVVGGFTAAVGLGSPLLFLAARPVVYHETELWGAAATLVALEALLRWWEGLGDEDSIAPRRNGPAPSRRDSATAGAGEVRRAGLPVASPSGGGWGRLALASLASLVAFNVRASVGGGAVAALVLTGGLALVTGRVPWRRAPAVALAALLPVLAYVAVNQARFGHPTEVPFPDQVLSSFDPNRQATLEATGGGLFGPEFAPTAVVAYLRPDGVDLQRLFPWITFREDTDVIGNATFDTVDRSASLPVVAPAFLLLAVVGLASILRRGWRDPWLTATVGAAAGLVATVTIAFIAHRYLSDATPALVLPAAVGVWASADWLGRQRPRRRRLGAGVLVALAVGGGLVSAALALQSQRLFILPEPAARHDLVAFQYDLYDALGGGAPPGVRQASTLSRDEPGERGEVVVLDGCRGLYWSDAQRWWPLELGGEDGLVVEGDGPVLLEGPTWQLRAEPAGDQVRLSYESDDDIKREGWLVDREDVDGPLTVEMDRVNDELTVRSGNDELLVEWLVDLRGPVRPGPGVEAAPAPTKLCDDVQSRLG